MTDAKIIALCRPHTVVLEACGLKRLIQLIVDMHGEQEADAIQELSTITNLPPQYAADLISAAIADRKTLSELDRMIWKILS
jgi:hypothetical protein